VRLGVTGHRPEKLGGYGAKTAKALRDLAKAEFTALVPELVITGMALGWDMACAEAAHELGIPFQAMIPFQGQEKIWPFESKKLYWKLLGVAKEVTFVSSPGYAGWKMLARDRAIVALSDAILALFNGSAGGTKYTVGFAAQMKTPVINCWERYSPPEDESSQEKRRPKADTGIMEATGPDYVFPKDTTVAPF
jgi:uncharacterized phage-like protein YoqJ